MKTTHPKSNGRIRSWLSGAFCTLAVVSFYVNYLTFTGTIQRQSAQQVQQAQIVPADYASIIEPHPVPLHRSGK
jgi:hypothetical protein